MAPTRTSCVSSCPGRKYGAALLVRKLSTAVRSKGLVSKAFASHKAIRDSLQHNAVSTCWKSGCQVTMHLCIQWKGNVKDGSHEQFRPLRSICAWVRIESKCVLDAIIHV